MSELTPVGTPQLRGGIRAKHAAQHFSQTGNTIEAQSLPSAVQHATLRMFSNIVAHICASQKLKR